LIGIDTLWLWSQPQDMRAGAGRLLNIVVNTVGEARAHPGCLFADLRSTRVKLLVHDGFGVVRPRVACTRGASSGWNLRQGSFRLPRCN
jgi:hypothetical protein